MNIRKHGDSGSVLVEFALALPVLFSLLMVCVDYFQLILMTQKVQRLSATMGDLVAQADSLSAAQLDSLFVACATIVQPFNHATSGKVIVSAVVLGTQTLPSWLGKGRTKAVCQPSAASAMWGEMRCCRQALSWAPVKRSSWPKPIKPSNPCWRGQFCRPALCTTNPITCPVSVLWRV